MRLIFMEILTGWQARGQSISDSPESLSDRVAMPHILGNGGGWFRAVSPSSPETVELG
jgi:hypothetical protein